MVETMAYAGQLPWHGLGVKVIDDLTPEQMMQKAGVDYSRKTRYDYVWWFDCKIQTSTCTFI